MQHLIRKIERTHYLTIHPIPLLLIILNRLLPPRLSLLPLLLRKIRPVKRTRSPQTKPGPHALQIEQMSRMAGQPHDERVLILQKRVITYRTGLVWFQRGARDSIEN